MYFISTKTNGKKFFSETKIFTNFKIKNKMKNLNLIELNAQELIEIEGGKSGGWTWLAEQIIDHWDEIKSGFRDGWNAYK